MGTEKNAGACPQSVLQMSRPHCWEDLCVRCSRPVAKPLRLCGLCFGERSKFVYWDRGPACRAKGPQKAECLLDHGHTGAHDGNGFDDYGPMRHVWTTKKASATTRKAKP